MKIPYYNSATLIAMLAITPELSLSVKGRRFCNFSVQTVYQTEVGTPVTDFINITCYDDNAEMVVRDCKVGDLLFVAGSLNMDHWEGKNGEHKSKITLVARTLQRLANGNGELPSATDYDQSAMTLKAYKEKGEHAILSSVMIHEYDDLVPERAKYPQPLPDGTWTRPIGDLNKSTRRFLKENPQVLQNMLSPVRPDKDADAAFARTIVCENLPVKWVLGKRMVFLPDGHYLTETEYVKRVEEQRAKLLAMTVEQRMRVLEIALKIYGTKIVEDNLDGKSLPSVPTQDEVSNAFKLAQGEYGEEKRRGSDDVVTARNARVAVGDGDSPEGWYQDENGNWHSRGNNVGGAKDGR